MSLLRVRFNISANWLIDSKIATSSTKILSMYKLLYQNHLFKHTILIHKSLFFANRLSAFLNLFKQLQKQAISCFFHFLSRYEAKGC